MPDEGRAPAWRPTALLAGATAFALDLHGADARKGTDTPYVSHLFSVCGLVIADGGSEDEAAAALLHDALEDHPERTSREDLAHRFGVRVAEIVAGCSDTPAGFAGAISCRGRNARRATSRTCARRTAARCGWRGRTSWITRARCWRTTGGLATPCGPASTPERPINFGTWGPWRKRSRIEASREYFSRSSWVRCGCCARRIEGGFQSFGRYSRLG